MIKSLLTLLLFVPTLLFGASIPFSGLQPDQFGSNVSSGKVWIKTGYSTTNANLYGPTTNHNKFENDGIALVGSVSTRIGINTDTSGAESGGRVSVISSAANDNFVLNAKGTGSILLNYDSPNAGVKVESANRTVASDAYNFIVNSSDSTAIDKGGNLGFGGYYNVGSIVQFGSIAGRKETAALGDYGGYLQFVTRPNGSGPAERMRITSVGNVGIGTTTPVSAIDIAGSFGVAIITKTTNYTLTAANYTVLVDTTAGAITITLPAAATATGRVYNVKKISADGNNMVVDADGGETIDGAANKTTATQYQSYQIQCDGTTWWVL